MSAPTPTSSPPAATSRPAVLPAAATTGPDGGPAIHDRGVDAAAITRSLVQYARWLQERHPDPVLVERVYANGGALARDFTNLMTRLRRERRRIREIDSSPFELAPLRSLPNARAFRMTEHLARRELLDDRGRVLQRVGPATEHYQISIVRRDARSSWRVLTMETPSRPVEVQL